MNRVQVIREILERWHELTEPGGLSGIGGGDGVMHMPPTYTPTVRELERMLRVMREDRHRSLILLTNGDKASVRSLWWHVSERYMRSRTTIKEVPVKRRAKRGKTLLTLERRPVTTYSAKVDLLRVDRGLQWLSEEWRVPFEPMLPEEIRVLVAA